MKLVKCKRCNGTGKYIAPEVDQEELAKTQEWLRAEEKVITGIEPVVSDVVIPTPTVCPRCGGAKKTAEEML